MFVSTCPQLIPSMNHHLIVVEDVLYPSDPDAVMLGLMPLVGFSKENLVRGQTKKELLDMKKYKSKDQFVQGGNWREHKGERRVNS